MCTLLSSKCPLALFPTPRHSLPFSFSLLSFRICPYFTPFSSSGNELTQQTNCWRWRFLCGPCRIKQKQAISYPQNFFVLSFCFLFFGCCHINISIFPTSLSPSLYNSVLISVYSFSTLPFLSHFSASLPIPPPLAGCPQFGLSSRHSALWHALPLIAEPLHGLIKTFPFIGPNASDGRGFNCYLRAVQQHGITRLRHVIRRLQIWPTSGFRRSS
jgi:hypothetical protein